MSPAKKSATATSFLAKAREAWGDKMPDWIGAVARAGDLAGSLAKVAKRLGTPPSNLFAIINKSHPGIGRPKSPALAKIEAAVRGVLMSEKLQCPALGMEIGRNDCAKYQGRGGSTASPDAFRLARMCPTCPNFLGGKQ